MMSFKNICKKLKNKAIFYNLALRAIPRRQKKIKKAIQKKTALNTQ